jgi:tetratricopeptide (TPR) repeat protein
MNNFYFWKSWNTPYKQTYYFLLAVFVFTLCAYGYAWYTGLEGVVKWDVQSELEPVKVVVDQFSQNLFNFSVESESYYALDSYFSTEVKVNTVYYTTFLVLVVVAVLFLLTTFSYLSLYWFLGSMMGFLFFLFSLKLELLELFAFTNRTPVVALFVLYSVIGYVFNAYYQSASYLLRLSSFSILTIAVAVVIDQYAVVQHPFLHLAHFGSLFPLAIAVLFVYMVGHDILKGFLAIVSGSGKVAGSRNALLNFLFASLLYLVNVFLLLMKKLYIFELNIIYINSFLLLAVSAVLGIWMYRKRSEMFSGVLPFVPAGAYVYLSLAIITMAGIAYALITGNSGMIDAYERLILYGHLFMGLIFLIYVVANFGVLFDKKISIYQIVYQPARMTYLAVPAIAITISTFFFLYQKKYPYHLAMAGYYVYGGDVHVMEQEYPLAFEYYRNAVSYDFPNHRANYSIASLAHSLQDNHTAKGYYENALMRDATVQSYIGLSNAYVETGELFKALFNIQDGLNKFPNDGRLYNNLGVLFHKSNLADSAVYYFLKAEKNITQKEVVASNIVYLLAKQHLYEEADSLLQIQSYPKHISYVNNRLAIYNQMQKRSNEPFDATFFQDTLLNANTYAYLINSSLNTLGDTAGAINKKLQQYKEIEGNDAYHDALTYQLALQKYYAGNRFEAVQEMLVLHNNTTVMTKYANVLGAWMLKEGRYHKAADYYREASRNGDVYAQVNYALAAAYGGHYEDARFVLHQLKNLSEEDVKTVAETMLKLIDARTSGSESSLDEALRLQYYLINLQSLSPEKASALYQSFANSQAKVYAGAALAKYWMDKGELAKAEELIASIQAIDDANPFAERERNYALLLLKAARKEGRFLLENLPNLPVNKDKQPMNDYFAAVGYEVIGDTAKAYRFYQKTLEGCLFADNAVAAAIRYLNTAGHEKEAYDTLVEILYLNPSVSMKKLYLELCLDMALINYAESMLDELKGTIPASEYAAYQKRLNELLYNI